MFSFDLVNFACMVINVLILFFLMKKFLFGRVDKIIAKRKEEIEKGYTDAENAKQDAENLHEEYEGHLKEIADEREKAMQEANAHAAEEYNRVVDEAKVKATAIIDKAKQAAEFEKEKAKKEQEEQIEQLVFSVASKMVGVKTSDEDNKKLYDSFLTKTGSNEAGGNK